jgi:hypothetical protein
LPDRTRKRLEAPELSLLLPLTETKKKLDRAFLGKKTELKKKFPASPDRTKKHQLSQSIAPNLNCVLLLFGVN